MYSTIVITIGAKANMTLKEELKGSKYKVVSVGDCHDSAKNDYRGIQEGFDAGINL